MSSDVADVKVDDLKDELELWFRDHEDEIQELSYDRESDVLKVDFGSRVELSHRWSASSMFVKVGAD